MEHFTDQANGIHLHDADTLGGRILRARDMTGKSIEEIAAHAGVTAETYAEWENDRSEPRANKLTTLAGILGVTPIWLMSGIGEGPDQTIARANLCEMRTELDRLKSLNHEVSSGIEAIQGKIEGFLETAK